MSNTEGSDLAEFYSGIEFLDMAKRVPHSGVLLHVKYKKYNTSKTKQGSTVVAGLREAVGIRTLLAWTLNRPQSARPPEMNVIFVAEACA